MKKKFIIFSIFLSLSIIVSAQQDALEVELGFYYNSWSLDIADNDFWNKSWPNSKIEEQKHNYKNGNIALENILIGKKIKRKQYFEDGKLFLEADVIQKPGFDSIIIHDPDTYAETRRVESIFSDLINGNFIEYFHNGTIKRKGVVKNARSIYKVSESIDSEQILFYSSGKIHLENIKEAKTTKRKQYFEDGKVQLEAEIKQLLSTDTIISYSSETPNETKSLSKYISDALDGNFIQYNPNGTIKAKGEVRNNLKVKHWIINNEEGKLIEDVNYNDKQLKEGEYTSYYPNGKIQKTGTYKIHFTEGWTIDSKTYREVKGQVPKETERGKWIYYNEDGTIKEEIDYK